MPSGIRVKGKENLFTVLSIDEVNGVVVYTAVEWNPKWAGETHPYSVSLAESLFDEFKAHEVEEFKEDIFDFLDHGEGNKNEN